MAKETYNIREASIQLGLCRTTVRGLVADGVLKGYRPSGKSNGKIVIDCDVLHQYKQECHQIAKGDKPWQSINVASITTCLLYTSPSPRDGLLSRMPSSA